MSGLDGGGIKGKCDTASRDAAGRATGGCSFLRSLTLPARLHSPLFLRGGLSSGFSVGALGLGCFGTTRGLGVRPSAELTRLRSSPPGCFGLSRAELGRRSRLLRLASFGGGFAGNLGSAAGCLAGRVVPGCCPKGRAGTPVTGLVIGGRTRASGGGLPLPGGGGSGSFLSFLSLGSVLLVLRILLPLRGSEAVRPSDRTSPSGPSGRTCPSGPSDRTSPSGPSGRTSPSGPSDRTCPSESACGSNLPFGSGTSDRTSPSGRDRTCPWDPSDRTCPWGLDRISPSGPSGQTSPSGPSGRTSPWDQDRTSPSGRTCPSDPLDRPCRQGSAAGEAAGFSSFTLARATTSFGTVSLSDLGASSFAPPFGRLRDRGHLELLALDADLASLARPVAPRCFRTSALICWTRASGCRSLLTRTGATIVTAVTFFLFTIDVTVHHRDVVGDVLDVRVGDVVDHRVLLHERPRRRGDRPAIAAVVEVVEAVEPRPVVAIGGRVVAPEGVVSPPCGRRRSRWRNRRRPRSRRATAGTRRRRSCPRSSRRSSSSPSRGARTARRTSPVHSRRTSACRRTPAAV